MLESTSFAVKDMQSVSWHSFVWKIYWPHAQIRTKSSIFPHLDLAHDKNSKNYWQMYRNSALNLHSIYRLNISSTLQIRSEEVYISEDFNFSASAGAYHSNKLQQQQHISRITPGVYPVIVNCRSGYPNPIPVAMQSVRILDLAQVDINWKMLTVARPSTKLFIKTSFEVFCLRWEVWGLSIPANLRNWSPIRILKVGQFGEIAFADKAAGRTPNT